MPVIKMKKKSMPFIKQLIHYDIPENIIHIPTEINNFKIFITQC